MVGYMIKIDYELMEQVKKVNVNEIDVSSYLFRGRLSYLEKLSKNIGVDLFLGKSERSREMFIFSSGGYVIAKVEERQFTNGIISKSVFYNLVSQYIAKDISIIDHLPVMIFDKELCRLISKKYQENLFHELVNSNLSRIERSKTLKRQVNDLNSKLRINNKAKNNYEKNGKSYSK